LVPSFEVPKSSSLLCGSTDHFSKPVLCSKTSHPLKSMLRTRPVWSLEKTVHQKPSIYWSSILIHSIKRIKTTHKWLSQYTMVHLQTVPIFSARFVTFIGYYRFCRIWIDKSGRTLVFQNRISWAHVPKPYGAVGKTLFSSLNLVYRHTQSGE
jgi:hypothetical protein